MYDALTKIQDQNLLNCSITEKLDSPIAQKASLALEMGSIDEEYMYLITAYYPDPLQWNVDLKTRKER